MFPDACICIIDRSVRYPWVHVRTISESPISEEYHIISETMEDPQFLVAEADDLQDSHPEEGNDSDDAIDQIRDQDR